MTLTEYVGEGHLGGYIAGGDPMTWCAGLWDYFMDAHHVRSVIDVGCGEGHALHYFMDRGCDVFGLEGIYQDDEAILQIDFTKHAFLPSMTYDLVWCCEVVEHIEERYMPNYLPSLTAGKIIAMTHALPGQGGYHHVNCRDDEYWKGVMAAHGRTYSPELTARCRELSPGTHFERSGLIFRA